jgi:hypothetical protein
MLSNQEKQKSLKRRFLLILGVLVFVALLVFGLMFILWDSMPFNLSITQRRWFGAFVIIYALIRFPRLLRKDTDEE